ncbi:winged helix-turn-helix domain-containing protein [Saccharothrix yanglingensis]|uniref:winged helix-turn-helix domain-containing protein n=1 Tax=Saccharothrix yanglingensis TaxID=659496 RepID=UPI0027D2ABA9|nr:transcriptional regulator [Saccharothrix yanglingensis]
MSARRTGAHPRHRLDEVIHAPVRLSAMAALAAADRIAFGLLRDTVEVSDSLLSRHVLTLETAGYVEVVKGYEGKRPRTWLSLTDEGRAAFERYQRTLRALIDTTTPAQDAD